MKLKELLTIIDSDINVELNILDKKDLFEIYVVVEGNEGYYKEYGNYEVNRIEPDYDGFWDEKIIDIYIFNSEIFETED